MTRNLMAGLTVTVNLLTQIRCTRLDLSSPPPKAHREQGASGRWRRVPIQPQATPVDSDRPALSTGQHASEFLHTPMCMRWNRGLRAAQFICLSRPEPTTSRRPLDSRARFAPCCAMRNMASRRAAVTANCTFRCAAVTSWAHGRAQPEVRRARLRVTDQASLLGECLEQSEQITPQPHHQLREHSRGGCSQLVLPLEQELKIIGT